MSVRSFYTKKHRGPNKRYPPEKQPLPEPTIQTSSEPTLTNPVISAFKTTCNAINWFGDYIAKNQAEYAKQTGDTSFEEDMQRMVRRVGSGDSRSRIKKRSEVMGRYIWVPCPNGTDGKMDIGFVARADCTRCDGRGYIKVWREDPTPDEIRVTKIYRSRR